MHVRYSLLASQATTAIFVLLWGSAIFTRWGLDNASPMALLVFRFLIALVALAPLYRPSARWLPAHPPADRGHRPDADWRLFGLLLRGDGQRRDAGTYRHHHGDPAHPYALRGGAPPAQGRRLSGLLLALAGLVLLVWRSLAASPMAMVGILFALAALLLTLWRAVAKAQPSGAGGCPAAAVCRESGAVPVDCPGQRPVYR
jgi:hypothetical protein